MSNYYQDCRTQAARLDMNRLRGNAAPALAFGHRCRDCWPCACAKVIEERVAVRLRSDAMTLVDQVFCDPAEREFAAWRVILAGRLLPHCWTSKGAAEAGLEVERRRRAVRAARRIIEEK